MKLSPFAFKRFWDVHAWAGVITSLVVYVMFVLGAVTLFYQPLTVWEEPFKQQPAPESRSLQTPLDLAKPLPEEFYYYLPKDDHGPPKVGYFLPDSTKWRMWWLDEASQRVVPQRELAAAYIYDLHYLWHDVTGFWLQYGAGVLVFGFLLAVVTGLLIHLKDVVPQLWRYRTQAKPRVVWSDLHKVTGVFGLPFQFMYALTGTLMALAPLIFSVSIDPVFGGDDMRATRVAGALIDDPPPRDYGPPTQPLSLDVLVARALAAEPRLTPESFVFRGYERAEGTVDVRGPVAGHPFGEGLIRVRAADGVVERVETPDNSSAVGGLARWIHGLHTVEYGGLTTRFLMLALAIAGCLTVLTGNWVWLARRDTRRVSVGNVVLARLTAGVGAGTVLAVSVLLLTSRLLPLELASRPRLEELSLALAFGGSVAWALCRRNTRATWGWLLGLSTLVWLTLPLAATLRSSAGLLGAGPSHPIVLGVELGFVVTGLVVGGATWLIAKRVSP